MKQKEIAAANKSLIVKQYERGLSVWEIGKNLNIAGQTVHKFMIDNGIPRRSMSQVKQKHSISESVFDVIDSHEKAYWLGLLYADGGMMANKNSYVIGLTLHRDDRYHIERFKEFLNSTHPIMDRKDKLASSLHIGNKHLCQSLIDKGVILRKSLKLEYPIWLEKRYTNSFILGYFDGDGSFYARKRKRYTTPQCTFSLVGTESFLTAVSKEIEYHTKISIKKLNNIKHSNVKTLRIEGRNQIMCLMKWLYADSTVYLLRKHKIYKENIAGYAGCLEKLRKGL